MMTRIGENIATNVSATEAITIAGITKVDTVVARGSSFGAEKPGPDYSPRILKEPGLPPVPLVCLL